MPGSCRPASGDGSRRRSSSTCFAGRASRCTRASAGFTAGGVQVAAGDYILRMDQPYRTLDRHADGRAVLRPGQSAALRRYRLDASAAAQRQGGEGGGQGHPLATDGAPRGGRGRSPAQSPATGGRSIIEHTTDNPLVTFRFAHRGVKMLAAEEPFEAGGRHVRRRRASSSRTPTARRSSRRSRKLGLSALAVPTLPSAKVHELDVPRIGYVHAWHRTQDEGWVRLAFDTFGVPYTYFADQKLREGNLRAKYDVIVYPPRRRLAAVARQRSADDRTSRSPTGRPIETPHLGTLDESDDIRGGMGLEGLANLVAFVQEGGTLIVEGSTAALLPAYGAVSSVSVEEPSNLFVRGSILKALVRRQEEPDRLRLRRRRAAGLFQPGAGAECRAGSRAELRGAAGGGAADCRRRHEHHAQRRGRRPGPARPAGPETSPSGHRWTKPRSSASGRARSV